MSIYEQQLDKQPANYTPLSPLSFLRRSAAVYPEKAAVIDGAGPIRIYFSIILPLLTPALVTTAVFSFLWTYEDFLTPLIYLTSIENYTVPQGLRLLQAARGANSWGPMLAMSLLSLVPMFVVFFIFQRNLIEGIATTGMKS